MNKSITCSIDGCDKRSFCRTWCSGHYHRWQRYGSPFPPEPKPCLQCREVFTPKRVDTRYCSGRCMDRAKVAANVVQYAETKRDYYLAHSDEQAEASAQRYQENREVILESNRSYYRANREKLIEYQTRYRLANADRIAATSKAWYLLNGDRVRAYRESNRGQIALSVATWARLNPEKRRANEATRRARRAGNGTFKIANKDARRLANAHECSSCGALFTEANPKHIDHVVPLARGGVHGIGNLRALCSRCNTSKKDAFNSVWRYKQAAKRSKP
ncbi:HNH endonuclease signature motif containing protein [Glaciihabitans sp. UYNi722]|uniref:HNH endonuclease signature motif containing protein n=1 Tax=Glaciihabitans sp. UYNi722 TaxID=3156344 RepID=UPI00339ABD14